MILCQWVGAKCHLTKCLGFKCLCLLCRVIKDPFTIKWRCLLNSKWWLLNNRWCSNNSNFLPWWLHKCHQYQIKASLSFKTLARSKRLLTKYQLLLWLSPKIWCIKTLNLHSHHLCKRKSSKFKILLGNNCLNSQWHSTQILNNLILNQNWPKKKLWEIYEWSDKHLNKMYLKILKN